MNETMLKTETTEKPNAELLRKLRGVSILSSLTDEQLTCFDTAEELHLAEGEHISRQGEVAHHFWMLLEGELRIYQTQSDGRDMTMALVEAGTALGELPLLTNIPNVASVVTTKPSHLLQLSENDFWNLMMTCPEVRKAILGNMAKRFQKLQSVTMQQEKMASLGTLAAGLMHELNNPGTAARRAASQLRENLLRMHELTAKFSKAEMSAQQKQCMYDLQERALTAKQPLLMNSLEQS